MENELFNRFKTNLEMCCTLDNESGHYEGDIVLKDMCISAANGLLNTKEVLDLIDIWNKIGKWYA
jgi:hypothetical protein